jgi:hypothetical protein
MVEKIESFAFIGVFFAFNKYQPGGKPGVLRAKPCATMFN